MSTRSVVQAITTRSGHRRVVVHGELDLSNAHELAATVASCLLAGQDLEVDLRKASFIDCTALRGIVAAAQHQREADRRMSVLVRPGSVPARVIKLAGLEALAQIRIGPTSTRVPPVRRRRSLPTSRGPAPDADG